MRICFLFALLVTIDIAYGQAPDAFKYQAVLRDPSGLPVKNRDVTLRVFIHEDLPTGTIVYAESHAATTNDFGLVNLEIGRGEVLSPHTFDLIRWFEGSFFMSVEMSTDGAQTFISLGTTQLLSVPYSLHARTAEWTPQKLSDVLSNGVDAGGQAITNAGGLSVGESTSEAAAVEINSSTKGFLPPRLTTDQRNAIQQPVPGLIIFNTSTGCLNYFFDGWLEVCGRECQQPRTTIIDAGAHQTDLTELTTVLSAEIPPHGTGQWTIQSGDGGIILDPQNAASSFTGESGQTYTLRWTVVSGCNYSTFDEVTISFAPSGQVKIGDEYAGGIVFYIDDEGNGLVAALSDQHSGIEWGCYEQNGGTASAATGIENTNAIVANCGNNTAAQICADLVLNGYEDWYLPTAVEAYQMYLNLAKVGLGEFVEGPYWTSNEVLAGPFEENTFTSAWAQNMVAGTGPHALKNTLCRVRAIRAFKLGQD